MLASYMTYLHAALTVIFCLICTYTDVKFRKIRNTHIIFMIMIGIYAQVVYHYLDLVSYTEILTVVLGGTAFSFLFYYWGIWAPGDAKLCLACMLLLPPIGSIASPISSITYMPIVLLINIFLPGLFFVVALALVKTTVKQKINVLSSLIADNAKILKNSALVIPIMLIVFSVTRQLLNWVLSPILQILELPSYLYYLVYLSFSLLVARKIMSEIKEKIGEKGTIILVIVSCLIALGLMLFMPIPVLLISFGFLLGIGILHTVLTSLLYVIFTDEISIMDLEESTIPMEQITRSEGENGLVTYTIVSSKEQIKHEEVILPPITTGIPSETLQKVKQLCQEGKFLEFSNKIKVCRPLHFAPIICFGVILTLLCQGPFYIKGLYMLN